MIDNKFYWVEVKLFFSTMAQKGSSEIVLVIGSWAIIFAPPQKNIECVLLSSVNIKGTLLILVGNSDKK